MVIDIDAVGDHDPAWCHMIVDRVGCLVDLSDIAGPLTDPKVTRIQWGPYRPDRSEVGLIYRKSSNNATSMTEVITFSDRAAIGLYLAAYQARMAEISAGQS
jgi:hypothetical protein